jgi:hypothetical protein
MVHGQQYVVSDPGNVHVSLTALTNFGTKNFNANRLTKQVAQGMCSSKVVEHQFLLLHQDTS